MKFYIIVDFSFGAYKIWFDKIFELPYSPFLGMRIYDNYKGNEITLRFDNTEHLESEIGYDVKSKTYYGQIKHKKLTAHYLENNYEQYLKCGWKIMKYCDNIEKVIEIIKANTK